MAMASPSHNFDLTADKVEDSALIFVDGSDQPATLEALHLSEPLPKALVASNYLRGSHRYP